MPCPPPFHLDVVQTQQYSYFVAFSTLWPGLKLSVCSLAAHSFSTRVICPGSPRSFTLTLPVFQQHNPCWVAQPKIEVVSSETFCQVKHSKKPMTRKPHHSLPLRGPCTPHVFPKLAWKTGVMRERERQGGDGTQKVEVVFIYEWRCFFEIKLKVFRCFP